MRSHIRDGQVPVLAGEVPPRGLELPILRRAGRRQCQLAEAGMGVEDECMRSIAVEVRGLEEIPPPEALIPRGRLDDALWGLQGAVNHVRKRDWSAEGRAVIAET